MSGKPTIDADGTRHFTDRAVPLPQHVSAAAKAMLCFAGLPVPDYPPLADKAAWRAHIAAQNAMLVPFMAARSGALPVTVSDEMVGGVACYRAVPHDLPAASAGKVVLDFHGGAFIYLAGAGTRLMAGQSADRLGVPVLSVDYRVPPDFPFPAAIEDGLAVYRALLATHDADDIIICGSSAGGNIAAAMLLMARDAGLAMPKAAIFLSPSMDMREGGDSFGVLRGIDPVLSNGTADQKGLYVGDADMDDPLLSPFRADFGRGFPPSLVQAGTRDMLLSSAVLFHRALRRALVPAELHIFEAMPHGGFGGAPEDDALTAELRRFINVHFGETS